MFAVAFVVQLYFELFFQDPKQWELNDAPQPPTVLSINGHPILCGGVIVSVIALDQARIKPLHLTKLTTGREMKIAPYMIGAIAVLVISLLAHANTPQTSNGPTPSNPLSGKVVILNPSAITVPHDNARIEELGGKKFVVYPVRGENGTTRESWTALLTTVLAAWPVFGSIIAPTILVIS